MSTPSFSVRLATLDDAERLVEIEARVHTGPWIKDHFVHEISQPFSRILLLTDDETDQMIAGYICYRLMDDYAEILNVAVDLQHRGLGFAQLLMQQVIRDALKDEMKRLTLDVRISNTAAISLYKKLGFMEVSRRKKFYSNGEAAVAMDLILNVANISGSS
ncbi:MAG: ribosomal protein S18-alanine N-acetyltransferase [Xanthomonadaceae bacterium]|nr:ribosomal protein S18-alanine N-acetyltransferase [Xanthomonadaceae bacterium]